MMNTKYSIEQIGEKDWLPFQKTADESGEYVILRASMGGGSFRMHAEDVWIGSVAISVRNYAPANVLEKPVLRSLEGVLPERILAELRSAG
jgi:hypothetical protein